MKEGFIIREQEKAHFITATVVDWIDVFPRKTIGIVSLVVWISALKIRA